MAAIAERTSLGNSRIRSKRLVETTNLDEKPVLKEALDDVIRISDGVQNQIFDNCNGVARWDLEAAVGIVCNDEAPLEIMDRLVEESDIGFAARVRAVSQMKRTGSLEVGNTISLLEKN